MVADISGNGLATATPGGAELRARLKAVLPKIAANADKAEAERKIPDENIALLQQTGFFRTFQPKRYGGLELLVGDYTPCLIDLAEACSATAWVASLLAQHVHALCLFTRQLQDDLWADGGEALVGSSVAPIGKAEMVDGGVTLSGKFGFSSGCDHAQWYILGFIHPGFEAPNNRQYAIVPRRDVTIIDDWFTTGMRGSGSKTLIVDKAFVPDHRTESLMALSTGKTKGFGSNDSAIYHAAFIPHFSIGFPAVAVGAALHMSRLYAEKTKSRIKIYTGQVATARAPAAMRLGRAMHGLNAALAFMEKDWQGIDARCAARQLPTPEEVFAWRTNPSYAIQLAIGAADELFGGSGGSAWFESNPMQREWRNVHMCGAHAGTDADTTDEIYGRHLLGLPLDPTL